MCLGQGMLGWGAIDGGMDQIRREVPRAQVQKSEKGILDKEEREQTIYRAL